MEAKFKPLDSEPENNDSVVLFTSARSIFKVDELVSAVKQSFHLAGYHELAKQLRSRGGMSGDPQDWSSKGVDCEVLKPGARSWRKGKLRINLSLEFCPDEPDIAEIPVSNQPDVSQTESSLDDICRMVNHNG